MATTHDDNNTTTTMAQNVQPTTASPSNFAIHCNLWTHPDHQSHHCHLGSLHVYEDSPSLISLPWITKLGMVASGVMDAMDGINRWKRAGAGTRLNWYWPYFFFVRSLRADLCVFLNTYIRRSFVKSFLHFLLPCLSCGRVASIFSAFFHCCLHLCTNGV